MENKERYLS